MIKKIKFEHGVHEMQIHNISGFKYLNLTSATINKNEYGKEITSVEMQLQSDRRAFTMHSNLIPGTNKLDCFDLLRCAYNIPALVNENFHTLKCLIPKKLIDDSIDIEMEFEIE